MAVGRGLYLPAAYRKLTSNFSTSCAISNKWRRQQGLEENPRKFGPLINLPDYSFVDGRPAILTRRKLNKLKYQEDLAEKIVKLTQEVDMNLEQFNERIEKQKLEEDLILKNKLKPKGAALFRNKNSGSAS